MVSQPIVAALTPLDRITTFIGLSQLEGSSVTVKSSMTPFADGFVIRNSDKRFRGLLRKTAYRPNSDQQEAKRYLNLRRNFADSFIASFSANWICPRRSSTPIDHPFCSPGLRC